VREFGMAAVMNGIALHGGYIPYGGTFLTFSDYSRNAIRMAALMKARVVHVFTHDSIGLGEDGPTHQSIEHAASLRLIPNLDVWRPCDTTETVVAWRCAIESRTRPSALLLSRQNLPYAPKSGFDASPPAALDAIARGAYVLAEPSEVGLRRKAQVVIMATGSEVQLALHAQQRLAVDGIAVRVVSMPSTTVLRPPADGLQAKRAAGRRAARCGRDGCYRRLVEVRLLCRRRHRHLRRVGAGRRPLQALRLHARQCGRHGASGFVQSEVQGNVMTIKVAINGYGRIGRNILRAHYEGGKKHDIQIVAINDLGKPETNAHLTRCDTAHGPFPGLGQRRRRLDDRVRRQGRQGRRPHQGPRSPQPGRAAWKDLGVDVVLECTGLFTSKAKASAHLSGGAKKVIISAPGGNDMDATVVYGVNHGVLKASDTGDQQRELHDQLPGAAGAAAAREDRPRQRADDDDPRLHERPGADRRLPRGPAAGAQRDPQHDPDEDRRGVGGRPRAAELNGRLDGYAMRVPTINVSIVDLSFIAARDTTVDEIHAIMKEASSKGPLAGILAYSDGPLVSVDFNHNPASSTYDATLTKVSAGSSRSAAGTTTSGASRTGCSTRPSR
jgi:glyceraldehyde-3-phosphate dehydrogenase/erythrose-4-phosphate dehydrogenase